MSEDEEIQWEDKLGYPINNDIAVVKVFVKGRKGQGSIEPHHDLIEIFHRFLRLFLDAMRGMSIALFLYDVQSPP